MSSTFGGLNTLVRALYAQQISLNTVGHNISNANTDGYTRQRVDLSASTPASLMGANGTIQVGTGVSVDSITRIRDSFVDKQYWKENSSLGYSQQTQDILTKLEGIFKDTSDTGVQKLLNSFWSSWQSLATDAANTATRTAVRQQGVQLVNAIQHADQQLKDLTNDINSVIDLNVDKINQITTEIGALNKQIVNIETGGTDHANDLRDRRDYLVDQLSALTKVSVSEDHLGNYVIQGANIPLVDGNGNNLLKTISSVDPDYGYEIKSVVYGRTNSPVQFTDGSMRGLLDARDAANTSVKSYMDKLSMVSQFLQNDFNAVHRNGYGMDNTTNNNFFGGASGTVNQISSNAVTVNPSGATLVQSLGMSSNAVFTLQVGDGTNSASLMIDPTSGMSLGQLAAAINNALSTAVPPVNVKANYDSVTDKFSFLTTGTATQMNFNGSDQNAINFLSNNLKMAVPTKGYWMDSLCVNPALFDPANGLNKIAAKTLSGNIAISQSDPNAGKASLSVSGTYTGGLNGTAVTVRVAGVDASGNVTDINYSVDGGNTWATASNAGPFPAQFTLANTVGLTLQFSIASTTNNQVYAAPVPPSVLSTGSFYTFTVPQGNASGDNAVLLSNRLKVDQIAALGNQSLDGFYASLVGQLGVQGQQAKSNTDNQKTLVDQIKNWRESSTGVNMDEEMTNMIKFQKAYNAAARVTTSMDEMLDKIINGMGTVGR